MFVIIMPHSRSPETTGARPGECHAPVYYDLKQVVIAYSRSWFSGDRFRRRCRVVKHFRLVCPPRDRPLRHLETQLTLRRVDLYGFSAGNFHYWDLAGVVAFLSFILIMQCIHRPDHSLGAVRKLT